MAEPLWTSDEIAAATHGRVAGAPAPSMRVLTRDAPAGTVFPDDGLPRYRDRPGRFVIRLLTTWAAMGFRNPRLDGVAD